MGDPIIDRIDDALVGIEGISANLGKYAELNDAFDDYVRTGKGFDDLRDDLVGLVATQWARQALAKKPEDMSVRYNTGCTFAVMGKLTPALENLEYMAAHSPRARAWLFGIVKHDTQWNSIRNLPEFEAFMSRLKAETAGDT